MTKKKIETNEVPKQEVPVNHIKVNGQEIETKIPLQIFSEMVNRAELASRVGTQTYGGNRDVYKALGYPSDISITDYYPRYKRQDIAKAVIDRPVKASWKGDIKVIENAETITTPFEKSWEELNKKFKLKTILMRADRLTGLGRYSVILFGLDDVKKIEDYVKPAQKGAKLVYLKPLSEVTAKIEQYEENVNNERYGLPLYYTISTQKEYSSKTQAQANATTFKVHYSRILHIVEDILEDETLGTPRLEAVWNRLLDLEKVIGGDAEMFWRGARPGYTGTVDKEYSMTPDALKNLQSQIDEFENNLRRVLINEGVDYKALAQQIADPAPHVDVEIQMISAVTGIPKRILVGSERGELSSAQDKQEWISYVSSRREEQNEPMILRPFIDKCIELGILKPTQTGYYLIIWDKLFSLSDKEKADVGKVRSEAIKNISNSPHAMNMLPLPSIFEHFAGFDTPQVDKIMELQESIQKVAVPDVNPDKKGINKNEPTNKTTPKRTKAVRKVIIED